MRLIRNWFDRHFSDPQVVVLTVLLVVATVAIITVAGMLTPVVAAIVIAYLLQGVVARVERLGIPHIIAVWLVFLAFVAFLLFLIFGLLPLLINQVTQLLQQMPQILSEAQSALMQLPEEYPAFVTEAQINQFMATLRSELFLLSQRVLTYSVSSVVAVVTLAVYGILVPFLVFFFIKDKDRLVAWLTTYLPRERALTTQVWVEVNDQIGNYVRGKFWEILIVGSVTYVTFAFLGLQYALLLAAITGLSVLIPYIGAAVVTFPVAVVAYFQFGLTAPFAYVMIAYGIIQALDGNVLAPLLFSEAVNLHPTAIIVAILFFGGLWGFWGVFFAIPLATVVKAVLRAWPRRQDFDDGLPDAQAPPAGPETPRHRTAAAD